MRRFLFALFAFFYITNGAFAGGFGEATIGIAVPSVAEAEQWYTKLIGPEAEIIRPYPGIVEIKATPSLWVQLFEVEAMPQSETIVRFLVEDMAATQERLAKLGIDSGEAIEVPETVIYSEFADPYGNKLGFYALP